MWRPTSDPHALLMLTSDLAQQRMAARMEDAAAHRLLGPRRTRRPEKTPEKTVEKTPVPPVEKVEKERETVLSLTSC